MAILQVEVTSMNSDSKTKVEIDLVEKITKQIITLSSGIVVVLITILGYFLDVFEVLPSSLIQIIFVSNLLFWISIIFGILVYGSLISSIHEVKEIKEVDVHGGNIKWFAILQWLTFILGISSLFLVYRIFPNTPIN